MIFVISFNIWKGELQNAVLWFYDLQIYKLISQKGYTNLHFHHQYMRVSIFSTSTLEYYSLKKISNLIDKIGIKLFSLSLILLILMNFFSCHISGLFCIYVFFTCQIKFLKCNHIS